MKFLSLMTAVLFLCSCGRGSMPKQDAQIVPAQNPVIVAADSSKASGLRSQVEGWAVSVPIPEQGIGASAQSNIVSGLASGQKLQADGRDLSVPISEKEIGAQAPLTLVVKNTGKPDIDTGSGGGENNELWLKNTRTGEKKLLVSCRDSEDMEKVIAGINNPQFSPDLDKVYFQSSAWAVSEAIHVVDLKTGQERYLCPGNGMKVIPSGQYRGDLIVEKHKYYGPPNYGSYDHYYIVDTNGKELRDLGENFQDIH